MGIELNILCFQPERLLPMQNWNARCKGVYVNSYEFVIKTDRQIKEGRLRQFLLYPIYPQLNLTIQSYITYGLSVPLLC